VLLAGLWSLWDQNRWQPWFYQYLLMFAVLALAPAPDDPECGEASLNACRLIVAAIYFWSGLQKLNINFTDDNYPWLMEPVLKHLPEAWHEFVNGRGWVAASVECGIGLGLLVWPLRPLAVLAALAMHLLILFCLGPWGHKWNTVVWPWNLAMMAFVVILFVWTRPVKPWHILWPRRCLFACVTLVLFGVLPLLSFFERWDHYLSAALYSGNTPSASVFITPEVYDQLPADARRHARLRFGEPADQADAACAYEVDLFAWTMAEMNVPPYPAERIARGVSRRLGNLPRSDEEKPGVRVILLLEGRSDWLTGKREQRRETFPEPE
jgi:hypothetical protein